MLILYSDYDFNNEKNSAEDFKFINRPYSAKSENSDGASRRSSRRSINDDDDESFPQVASCPGWLVGGISYLGPVLILFRLHSTPSNMSFIKDYSGGDEED